MELLDAYRRALDGFDAVLVQVPQDRWDAPTPCTEWTVRDIVGHVVWGQETLRSLDTGSAYEPGTGSPGSTRPGVLAGDDPLATWRTARAAADATLDPDRMDRPVTLPGAGEMPLAGFVVILRNDTFTHTWDIGAAIGRDVVLDPDVLTGVFAWSRENIKARSPVFFQPEVAVPDDADEQTRFLAYLGRNPSAPVRTSA